MDRSSLPYALLHYILMIAAIFAIVVAVERAGVAVTLWLGVPIAILVGLLYPRAVRELGIAPSSWER